MRKNFYGSKIISVDQQGYKEYGFTVETEDGRAWDLPPQGGVWLLDGSNTHQTMGTCDYPFRVACEDFLNWKPE